MHLACSESHFELELLLYTANYSYYDCVCIFVYIIILSHKSLIRMEDCDHCMHGYSRHGVINGITCMKCVEKHVHKKN